MVDTRQSGPQSSPREPAPIETGTVLRQAGGTFIATLSRAVQGAALYHRNNEVLQRLIQDCLLIMNPILRTYGHLHLRIVRDTCYANNVRAQVGVDDFTAYKALINDLRQWHIGELTFSAELMETHLLELVILLRRLETDVESNYLLLRKHLHERHVTSIDVGKLEVFDDEFTYLDTDTLNRQSKMIYFAAIELSKELMDSARANQSLPIRKAKRLMVNMVGAIRQDASTLLGLANIKSYDAYAYNHPVNVAIYAIALGQRAGLSRTYLCSLGVAALLHDIGNVCISHALLHKADDLTPREWDVVHMHPLRGAEIVMQQGGGWCDLMTRLVAATLEHHVKYDLSGYPTLPEPRVPSLFSRIITIADCYDALCRPRVADRAPCITGRSLALMSERSGKDFDPILMKLFISMIGRYPLGSLVALDTGDIAIVTRIQNQPELLDQPYVLVLEQVDEEYRARGVVNLGKVDRNTGGFARMIVRTLDPNDYQINIEEFFL